MPDMTSIIFLKKTVLIWKGVVFIVYTGATLFMDKMCCCI